MVRRSAGTILYQPENNLDENFNLESMANNIVKKYSDSDVSSKHNNQLIKKEQPKQLVKKPKKNNRGQQ